MAFPRERIVLGGDHLGPFPWKHLPAVAALAKADDLAEAYASAVSSK
jgi:tagatose-1,6-bisphosphate aldolase non-catalytic subunit AgaZ/GatZ